MTASDLTVINFSSSTGNDNNANTLSIELDNDYHIALYGEAKTEFNKEDIVYLKVYPGRDISDYDILKSSGKCFLSAPHNSENVVDLLSFVNTKSASFSVTPAYLHVEYEWVSGGGGVGVLINEKGVTISKKTVGILSCEYVMYYDRLKLLRLPNSKDNDQIIVMIGNETRGYVSITVNYTEEESTSRDLTIVIRNVDSEAIIAGASVAITLEGISIFDGTTNEEGRVTVPSLVVGTTYDIKVTATDYFDTNVDVLNNDTFTVPEIPT